MFKITQLTDSAGRTTYAVVDKSDSRIMFNSKHRTECARWIRIYTPKCVALCLAGIFAAFSMIVAIDFMLTAVPVWRAEAAISNGADYTVITEELNYQQCCLLDYYLHQ